MSESLPAKLYIMKTLEKLNKPLLQTKTYRSILKTFSNEKEILLIPHLLVKDRFLTDVKTKVNIFNNFLPE